MKLALALVALAGCPTAPVTTCEPGGLFGAPNANTGLSDAQCGPACDCGGAPWTPPAYTEADVAALRAWTLAEPYAPLEADPYAAPLTEPAQGEDPVCAAQIEGANAYRLASYPAPAAAAEAGARLTHYGACGLCSTFADLAVYIEQPDLTEPVRACGLAHWNAPFEELVGCIEALGFTRPCAQIWAYNTLATRQACGGVCLSTLDDPYHLPDGSLNACLQCDEDESGPVFKAVAGRTRRNTGLPSSMCRPCAEVRPVEHRYGAE